MFQENISEEYLVQMSRTSEGSQRKYYKDGYWYNGVSLLTANRSVNWHFPIEENVKRVVAKPFSGSFDVMHQYFGDAIAFRIEDAAKSLSAEPQSIERDVLLYQLAAKAVKIGKH